jgi:PAS domain S-box-containing protein
MRVKTDRVDMLATAAAPRNARILIVDHEPYLLQATSRLLREAGYEVTEAATGQEGLRLVRETRPDLVLLDAMLPDMDGLQACRHIKADAEFVGRPVVLLSGRKIESDSQAEDQEIGADAHITRPISDRELLARVEAMLRIQHLETMHLAQMHELQERIKELNCLYSISELVARAGISLTEILEHTVQLLPPAWQYPEIACARILLEGQEFKTEGFRDTNWKQVSHIRVHGELAGTVELCYLEEKPEHDEGPFLHEEQSLIDAVAERLGRVVERLRTQEALKESQERYRAVSELTSDLAYAFRVEPDGTLVPEWMTKPLSAITGYSSAELAERGGWASVIHPDDQLAAQQHIQTLLSGQPSAYELRIIARDGQIRWLHDSGHPFWDEAQGRVVRIYGAARDITENKQAEEDLLRYETIVSTVSDPISYVDRDYIYRAVNDTYASYAKRPREEIVGHSIAEMLGTQAFEREVKPHFDRCLAGERVFYQAWFDVPGEQPKFMDVGYYPVFNHDGSVSGVVVSSRDMTKHKRAEEALQRERDLVARIMDTSPVGITVFDRQGRITFANSLVHEVAKLTGASTSIGRIYNDPAWRLMTEDGRPVPDGELPFTQVLNTGRSVHNIRHAVELPDSQWLFISSNAAPLFDESGEIDSVVVTIEDITDQVQAEKRAEQAVAAAERERLARDLHDAVTQSLFSVAAIAEALPHVWKRDPQEAWRGLEELRRLTQGALAEMRTMLLELRPAALAEHRLDTLLDQLTEAMMGRTRIPVKTQVVGDCSLPTDAQIALYRIAQEALNNIAKHARASQATVHLDCSPGHAELSIRDDGGGFDQEIVQPHHLGLKIMHERAQAVGATLKIESQSGQGTVIVVNWRASEEGHEDG